MTNKKVLILTKSQDSHSDVIADELRCRHVPVLRFDQSEYPNNVVISTTMCSGYPTKGYISYQGACTPLSDITSLWRRRPTLYVPPDSVTPGEKIFLEDETRRGIEGLFDSHVFSVSKMLAIRASNNKVVQLQRAQQLQLTIPKSLFTNDPTSVLPFYESCDGQVITKPVQNGFIEDDPNNKRLIFTNVVTHEHLSNPTLLHKVGATTHLFQEHIPKAFDLRVVIMGRQIFAVEIHTPADNHDFRSAYADATYHVHQLPSGLSNKLLALVKSFDLQFSSMDLMVTKDGEYVWVELNPNGQFYWLQYQLENVSGERCPLKEAMADLLSCPEEYKL